MLPGTVRFEQFRGVFYALFSFVNAHINALHILTPEIIVEIICHSAVAVDFIAEMKALFR